MQYFFTFTPIFLLNKMLDKFEDHFERMKPYPKLLEVRGKNMKLIMVV